MVRGGKSEHLTYHAVRDAARRTRSVSKEAVPRTAWYAVVGNAHRCGSDAAAGKVAQRLYYPAKALRARGGKVKSV